MAWLKFRAYTWPSDPYTGSTNANAPAVVGGEDAITSCLLASTSTMLGWGENGLVVVSTSRFCDNDSPAIGANRNISGNLIELKIVRVREGNRVAGGHINECSMDCPRSWVRKICCSHLLDVDHISVRACRDGGDEAVVGGSGQGAVGVMSDEIGRISIDMGRWVLGYHVVVNGVEAALRVDCEV